MAFKHAVYGFLWGFIGFTCMILFLPIGYVWNKCMDFIDYSQKKEEYYDDLD